MSERDATDTEIDAQYPYLARLRRLDLLALARRDLHLCADAMLASRHPLASVYDGCAGVALLAVFLGDAPLARRLLAHGGEPRRAVSLVCGAAGVHATAVLAGGPHASAAAAALLAIAPSAASAPSPELLYGAAGYAAAALLARVGAPTPELRTALGDAARLAARRAREAAIECDGILEWAWHLPPDKLYIGAAHGAAGVLNVLLAVDELCDSNSSLSNNSTFNLEYLKNTNYNLKLNNNNTSSSNWNVNDDCQSTLDDEPNANNSILSNTPNANNSTASNTRNSNNSTSSNTRHSNSSTASRPARADRFASDALVGATLDALAALALRCGGRLPTRRSARSARLVQWCHGAPGCLPLLARARPAAGAALQALARDTAARGGGAQKRSLGLCHGVPGNALALLAYARHFATNNTTTTTTTTAGGGGGGGGGDLRLAWLDEAARLALVSLDDAALWRDALASADAPHSLFGGVAGRGLLLLEAARALAELAGAPLANAPLDAFLRVCAFA